MGIRIEESQLVLTLVKILYRDLIGGAKRYNGKRERFKLEVRGVGKRTDGMRTDGIKEGNSSDIVLSFSPD